MSLADLLARDRPIVLDGGLATELEAQGHDLTDGLWSARLLRDDPEAIEQAHVAYLRAGAEITICASYQASVESFGRAGMSSSGAEQMLTRSVELARAARTRVAEEQARVAARPRRGLGRPLRRESSARARSTPATTASSTPTGSRRSMNGACAC